MVNIALLGACGRMGRVLNALIAKRSDCCVCAGIDKVIDENLGFTVFDSIEKMLAANIRPDVIIDFSNPDVSMHAIDVCKNEKIPLVLCTTGLPAGVNDKIKEACIETAIFYSANMSLGVNVLGKLAKRASEILKDFDIEIIEKHHRNKLDAPSGTALMLADAINETADNKFNYVYNRSDKRQKRADDEIGISSLRGGSIVGEHDIVFAGNDEVVTLSHTAYSRNIFAQGAISAALFLADKKQGLFSMNEMLDMI